MIITIEILVLILSNVKASLGMSTLIIINCTVCKNLYYNSK